MQASRTALIAAVFRGRHRELHAAPWVLDDPHAPALVGPQSAELWAQLRELFPAPLCDQVVASICARSRFVEDCLAAGSFDQYVLLGAGLDSFAWRRPKPLATVRVFEVDHPASQQAKRDRACELALPNSDRHVFAPCDFETETLAGSLDAAGFDWMRPALFGWLGVTMYLTIDAIEATCRLVAKCAPGTVLALSYALAAGHVDADGERLSELFSPLAERSGEPIISRRSPADAEALLTRCGLSVVDHPTHEEIHERYFAGRTDGLRPAAAERVLAARTGLNQRGEDTIEPAHGSPSHHENGAAADGGETRADNARDRPNVTTHPAPSTHSRRTQRQAKKRQMLLTDSRRCPPAISIKQETP